MPWSRAHWRITAVEAAVVISQVWLPAAPDGHAGSAARTTQKEVWGETPVVRPPACDGRSAADEGHGNAVIKRGTPGLVRRGDLRLDRMRTEMLDVIVPLTPLPPRVLLRDRALVSIRDAIVRGDLAPGSLVKDGDLAAALGLGVAPVRAALARLIDEGLVEAKPQSHTRVTPCAAKQVHDAGVLLRAVHQLAVELAVPAVTADDVSALRASNAAFADAVAVGDVDGALAADDALHDVLLRRSGNAAIAATAERYTPVVRRLERQRFGSPHGHDSVLLHDRLIDACEAGDVASAVAATTRIWTALLSELNEEITDGAV
jgi:DNA-binding GntR family transcriptional regulator